MSDQITAKGSDQKFTPHGEGQFIGVCVDTISLGLKVETFPGSPEKLAQKCVVVFRTGERNGLSEYIDIAREFTVSMNENANLRKFLEQWRGKPYTAEQVEAGVPLHKLTGQPALLTIAHKTSGKGRTYANIVSRVGVPKQMAGAISNYPDYTRAEYWDARRKEYAEGVSRFKAQHAAPSQDDRELEEQNDDDEGLPF